MEGGSRKKALTGFVAPSKMDARAGRNHVRMGRRIRAGEGRGPEVYSGSEGARCSAKAWLTERASALGVNGFSRNVVNVRWTSSASSRLE